MKLTLIKPNFGINMPNSNGNTKYVDEGRMEPLQLGVLAGLTPEDVEVKFYDDRCENIPFDEETDLVAITVETFTAKRAYDISKKYKKRNVQVILGGIHPSLIPEESKLFADSILIGDAENIWIEIINDAKKRKLKPVYFSKPGIPQPGTFTRRDIFKNKGYLPVSLLQFSRGCSYSCNYCAVQTYFNQKCYTRKISEVIKEIELQNKKILFFVDDNIVANHSYAKELFKALIPLKINWFSQGSIDMTNDYELMKLMKESGCLGNVIGFESITEKGLKSLNKNVNLHSFSKYKKELEILKDYGLQNWAAFTLGHDAETLDSIDKTLEFALSNKFCFAAFNILTPYPKTELYQRLQNQNRLLYDGKWWLHPDYRLNYAAFIPKNMTADELTEKCFEIRKKWSSIPSIIKRFFNIKTNLMNFRTAYIFLRYNYLFRKEIFKKQN